jgi:hypothetical protein
MYIHRWCFYGQRLILFAVMGSFTALWAYFLSTKFVLFTKDKINGRFSNTNCISYYRIFVQLKNSFSNP